MKNRNRLPAVILILILAAVIILILLCVNRSEQEEPVKPENLLDYIGTGLEKPGTIPGHQLIDHTGYTLSYNEEYEVADWVAYEFTNEELNTEVAKRKDNFREDPEIITGSAQLSDYKKSGYSRGHLAPAADFKWSEEAMSDTFFLSNMTPQLQSNFNAGIWLNAENFVREICSENQVVFVATGPVLTDGPYETIGQNKVAVPKRFYKVLIAVKPDGQWTSFAMIIPQSATAKDNLYDYFCTINEVEEMTSLDFFHILEDGFEEEIESYRAVF